MSESFTERFDRYWDERPVTSLRRVQTLYGAIAEARSGGGSVVPEEFQLYVTPGELDGFTTAEGGSDGPKLVTVYVDLTDEPTLDGVEATTFRQDDVPKLGFSRYPWGRGIDHSITRRGAKGGSPVSTATTYCVDCLRRWTNADDREPAVGRVVDEHPDGWIIEGLQSIGQRDGLKDDLEGLLKQSFDGGARVTATVAIKLDTDGLEHAPSGDPDDGYYYPGQLHVLNAGMRARKEEKLARKNLEKSDPPSRGEAACLVTGETETVFGTAEDPLAFFTVQHAEKFNGLKKPEAWRAHSISAEAALLIQSGSSMVEGCRTTRRGRSIYTIPYFTQMDGTRAQYLDFALGETAIETQADLVEVQKAIEARDEGAVADLRFYVVVVRNDSGDINVLTETPDLSIQPARELAEAHMQVLEGSTFDKSAGFNQPPEWVPISDGITTEPVLYSIVDGLYAYGTLSTPGGDAPPADDPADWLTFTLLSGDGEAIPVERLLDEYVERIVAEQRDDDENRLPESHLKTQFAQLEALARVDRLTTNTTNDALTALTRMPTATTDTDVATDEFLDEDGNLVAFWNFRKYRLDRFIEERPAFEEPDRLGAFLAGVLVGQVGDYQAQTREMNQTVLQQYPAEQMTGGRINQFVPKLVDKMNAYASDTSYGSSLFPELEERLTDLLGAQWEIRTSDLRFHYAIGQLYGKRARNRAHDLREDVARQSGIELENNQ
ncbi:MULTISPECIES: TM1802 family CRISPR-associated protein [unclassified Haloferax]|uniref:TM1802 family CRISPR-associated protein n=1 Tax=unclassified Haloferax TaxID=2625095 RepID=UPI002874B0A4|nr:MULTISPECIES: TM1802 family CRISPR-associated protein [unclassified Haloferax]MDS0241386.1 hypothetical protein [Haloferax sp. S2CR25]MDS0444507.1 hypothetical protein [Haloferax sp. S2CR25-2]